MPDPLSAACWSLRRRNFFGSGNRELARASSFNVQRIFWRFIRRSLSHRYSGLMYVAVEGIDGSGKSSAACAVEEGLQRQGRRVVRFEYLGRRDHMLGRFLQWTFHSQRLTMSAHVLNAVPAAKMLLYQRNAVVNWHIVLNSGHGLRPACDPIVVGDRSIVSLLVNFPEALGERRWAELALKILPRLPLPSDIFYLDVSPQVAWDRLVSRGAPLEANETTAELAQSRAIYEDLLFARPLWFMPRVHRIDGTLPRDDVVVAMTSIIRGLVGR